MSKTSEFCINSYIERYFKYDSNTGIITRSDRKGSNGSFDKDGYLIIKIKGRQFKSHRLAWFLYYGNFPENNIDHINRNRTDNRIVNLRDVEQKENVENTTRQPHRITGIIGVHFDRTKGLKKNYTTKYKNKTYRFYTKEEAIEFRKSKNLEV